MADTSVLVALLVYAASVATYAHVITVHIFDTHVTRTYTELTWTTSVTIVACLILIFNREVPTARPARLIAIIACGRAW